MIRAQCHAARPAHTLCASSPSCSSGHTARVSPLPARSSATLSLRLVCVGRRRRRLRSLFSSCHASSRSVNWDGTGDDDSDQFLHASLLVPETIRHYKLWKRGFVEETVWQSRARIHPSFVPAEGVKSDVSSSIGRGFLRQFQSPTIFLKIDCDGGLLLPIIVGEIAIHNLFDSLRDDQYEECPDQFKFARNFVGRIGYEVKMVQITKRVVNTYYARIFLGKPTERANISIDARPSDAINVAKVFKAPIYVSKELVIKDGIKVVYGAWRGNGGKTVYDVSLDSSEEGPDPVAEELDLLRKMNIAAIEERYEDAAMWRDKLTRLRTPRDRV